MSNSFALTFIAKPEHIDENGHVNNAVWVQWMEALATAHWNADADPAHVAAYAWLVTRHEIDYRGNIGQGEQVEAVTEVREGPSGARFDRHFTFTDASGKAIVRAKTTWAMVDRQTGRVMRVPPAVVAPFQPASASSSASTS
jgi:acyl-CoA thioester hydrolase